MFVVLKTLHLLCLVLGGASLIGNAVLLKRVMAAGAAPPMVAEAMKVLGSMGLGAIVVLWLTGIPMAVMTGAFAGGGWAFQVKLLAATAVLVIAPVMAWMRAQAAAGRRPMNLALMARLSLASRWLVVVAIALAVVAFR